MFGFQRLDVYRCAISFLSRSAALTKRAPRGHADLADQLRRAALSVPLNIAEGTAKDGADAARFFGIARGSALECAAIVDALEALGAIGEKEAADSREQIDRVAAMLTRMSR